MILAIDLSLRSAGMVILDKDGRVVDCMVTSNKDDINEALIKKNTNDIIQFIEGLDIDTIAIEGLSFASISSSKDIIAGNMWYLRCMLTNIYNFDLHIVPVSRWRSKVISPERTKELKRELGVEEVKKNKKGKETKRIKMPKNWQKNECLSCLPIDLKLLFKNYVESAKLKKEAIFDLTDAFWLGQFIIKNVDR